MPFQSPRQRRLFYAAASKKGGAGGVSRTVARKFIADSGETPPAPKRRIGLKRK